MAEGITEGSRTATAANLPGSLTRRLAYDTYDTKKYSQAGALELAIRKQHPRVEISDRDMAREIADRLEGMDDERRRRNQHDLLEAMPTPETFPAFLGLQVDRAGNLWVREFAVPDDERRLWSVFEPEGTWLGTVEVPQGAGVLEIGNEHIIFNWSDDLGIEYIQLYRLIKPR